MIISLISQKGGVGKSTLARLLAVEIAKAGWRVKIADLCQRAGCSVGTFYGRVGSKEALLDEDQRNVEPVGASRAVPCRG